MPQALPAQRTVLAWGPTRVAVLAGTQEPLAWLTEFLAPWFVTAPAGGQVALTVVVAPGAGAFTTWRRGARLEGTPVACFTVDGGADAWAPARGKDGTGGFVDDTRGLALTREETSAGPVLGVHADEDGVHARACTMRVLREVASAAALARGEVPVHAAAVASGEAAILFVGPRRAGKSTLLLHALRTSGVDLLSNDRAFVRLEQGVPQVRGMPTILSLREGTVAAHPALEAEMARGCWRFHLTVAECQAWRARGERPPPLSRRDVPGLSAAQFSALEGVGLRAEARCARIVLPCIRPTVGAAEGFILRDLAPHEAARRIVLEGRTAGGGRARGLDLGLPGPDLDAQRATIEAWTSSVPCHALDLGPTAYEGDALRAALGLAPRR